MPTAQVVLEDGRSVELDVADDVTDLEIENYLNANMHLLGEGEYEDVYDADTGATISAPIGMDADEIQYHDRTQNLGEPEANYIGYKNVAQDKSVFDQTMEFLAAPMDIVASGSARGINRSLKGAAAVARAIGDTGILDGEGINLGSLGNINRDDLNVALEKAANRGAKIDKHIEANLSKYKDGKVSSLVVGGVTLIGDLPYIRGLVTKKGIAIIGGIMAASKSEDLYTELKESGFEEGDAKVTSRSLAPVLTAAEVIFDRIFVSKLTNGVKTSALKKIYKSAMPEFAAEALPSAIEDTALTVLGARDLSVEEIVIRSVEAGLTGAIGGGLVGAGAAGIEASSNAQVKKTIDAAYDEGITKHLNDGSGMSEADVSALATKLEKMGVASPQTIATDVSQAVVEGSTQIQKAMADESDIVNKNPELIDEFMGAVEAIEKGDEAKVAKSMKAAGVDEKQTSEVISKMREAIKISDSRANNEVRAEDLDLDPEHVESVRQITESRKGFLDTVAEKLSDTLKQTADSAEAALTPLSSRLTRIAPHVGMRLDKYDSTTHVKQARRSDQAQEFYDKFKKLSTDEKAFLDHAMKNRWQQDIDKFLEKKPELKPAFENLRNMFNEIRADAQSVNMDLGFLENYYPRVIKDTEGFLKAVNKNENWSIFQDVIDKIETNDGKDDTRSYLSVDEKADIINKLLMGQTVAGFRLELPANARNRVINEVTPELAKYYEDTPTAIAKYITDMTDAIEMKRLFGDGLKEMPDKMSDTIAHYVMREAADGNMDPGKEELIKRLLGSRFNKANGGKIAAAGRIYKNTQYVFVMGSIRNAVTQIGDLYTSYYKNGVYATNRALFDSVTGRSEVTKQAIGIDTIAAEFAQREWSGKMVDMVFTANFLKTVDSIGKNTFINSTRIRMQKLAREGNADLQAKIDYVFENEADQVMQDLKDGVNSENVKALLFMELTKVQPITLSQMPELYNKHPNGRVFYMLKSFTLRHLDLVRTEVFDQIKTDPVQGGKNLVQLAALFTAFNASASMIKDLMRGEEVDYEDAFIESILAFVGTNKFTIDQFGRGRAGDVVWGQITPPSKVPTKLKDLPVVGEPYHYWFRGGNAPDEGSTDEQLLEDF